MMAMEHPAPPGDARSRRVRPAWRGICLALLLLALTAGAGDATTNPPAAVKVSGFGWLGNREMVRLLRNFQPDEMFPPVLNRNFMEDAALVLFSRAHSEGFLNATLEAKFTLPDGSREKLVWTNVLEMQLNRDFTTKDVHFRVRKGARFYYKSLTIEGVEALPKHETRSYFVSGETLIRLRRNRPFTPELLTGSMSALEEALSRLGYRSATVRTNAVLRDETSGAVTVDLSVVEGLQTLVRSVTVTIEGGAEGGETNRFVLHPDAPYSILWQQDLARELEEQQYVDGYPDATAAFSTLGAQTNADNIQLDLAAQVRRGPRVRVGEVKFAGNHHTRTSALENRMKIEPGDWLNRIEAEESRQRLARLGVFESVRLSYEEVDPETRDVVYQLQEGKPLSLSVLAGYGSYELLRGGLEFEHSDVLGLAHNLRLRAIQSFKSSSGDVQYTVPDLLGERMDVFVKAAGLRREEVSFTREEYGGSVGVQKHVELIQSDVSLHYDYEFLNTADSAVATNDLIGVSQARSAAFVLDINHDRRQTQLLPQSGLKLFGRFEYAADALGGNVDYQRVLLGGSYHLDLHGGRLLHLALTHAMSFTWGGPPEDLPFNKRFFPGGENSVRGYQEGEASPVDADGNQLGAETYTLGNIEFEQLLTRSFSLVAFFDAVGMAQDRANYPWDEGLYSVGGGIAWRTMIGPVRLEYGHNLNPRPHDPDGTLHFSIGFPF